MSLQTERVATRSSGNPQEINALGGTIDIKTYKAKFMSWQVRHLSKRFALSISHARLVADLQGYRRVV